MVFARVAHRHRVVVVGSSTGRLVGSSRVVLGALLQLTVLVVLWYRYYQKVVVNMQRRSRATKNFFRAGPQDDVIKLNRVPKARCDSSGSQLRRAMCGQQCGAPAAPRHAQPPPPLANPPPPPPPSHPPTHLISPASPRGSSSCSCCCSCCSSRNQCA